MEFRNVGFGYPGSERPVLNGLSFALRPGETSAIIGGTGSGKTTLLNLIPRFFDVTDGAVLVNGVDVRDQETEQLWAGIGLVPQAAFLFSGTVGSNLRFGRPDATEAELWRALDIGAGVPAGGGLQLRPGLHHGGHHPARDVRAAAGRGSETVQAAAAVLDSHPHGDILSRVTNDIDNLTTTLQQGLSQLLTSVLTIAGVLGMMVWISPLLAAVSVITVPLAVIIAVVIARRSRVQFTDQWDRAGTLNGLVEETHTGHALVQVFGRRQAVVEEFARQNRGLRAASFRAQFLSGTIQPLMQILANLNYVAIAVIGGTGWPRAGSPSAT